MDKRNELLDSIATQAVTLGGKTRTILASIFLHELYQREGSKEWTRRGKTSKGIFLAGDIWILKVPSTEGGGYEWLKLSPIKPPSNLRGFYKGGDSSESWGPARKFAKLGQEEPVSYSLLGKEWDVVDIGAFEAEVSGKTEVSETGDRFYFVTSRKENEWLVYLDSRTGEAKGTGGLFLGNSFEPNETIEEIL